MVSSRIYEMESDPHIILASASPRRGELLAQIGVRYLKIPADLDEQIGAEESPSDAVIRLSREKAERIWATSDNWSMDIEGAKNGHIPVLGADTIVVHEGKILQKPGSREEGVEMLEQLSGERHQVMSALSVATRSGVESALSISNVTFRQISKEERGAYWESGEPTDKAGGYAVQGLGAVFITHLEGSYSGVMGLPLFETAQLLSDAGVNLL